MRSRAQQTALQRWEPPINNLIWLSSTNGEGTGVARFRVPIPDSRLRVKVSLLFVPIGGSQSLTPDISSGGATLWLYETEQDRSGNSGAVIPSTNILGTQAAPSSIPAAAGLLGYSREFVTAADNIEGVLSSTSNGVVGFWVLQCSYQPSSVRFTEEEWDEITSRANPYAPSQAQKV